jgi:hypothetical protein
LFQLPVLPPGLPLCKVIITLGLTNH